MKTLSCICTKCSGSGNLTWTDNDGGVCYKCEGLGYLGIMPEGFIKKENELIAAGRILLYRSLKKHQSNGVKELQYSTCTGDKYDAEYIKRNNLVFQYHLDDTTMKLVGKSSDFLGLFMINVLQDRVVIKAI